MAALSAGQNKQFEAEQNAALKAENAALQEEITSLKEDRIRADTETEKLRSQIDTYAIESTKIKKELDQSYIDMASLRDKLETAEVALETFKKSSSVAGPLGSTVSTVGKFPEEMSPDGETATESAAGSGTEVALPFSAAPVVDPVVEPIAPSAFFPEEEPVETPEASLEAGAPEAAGTSPEGSEPVAEAVEEPVTSEAVVAPSAPETVSAEVAGAGEGPESGTVIREPQIMTVNRNFNFVVINIGMDHELKMGDRLEVLRNEERIAEIQIEKLYDRFSAATILSEKGGASIEKGDRVNKL
ncbi:MAG: hypothetical protein ACOY3K_08925 [Candidatus Omnitrophota bacterium]